MPADFAWARFRLCRWLNCPLVALTTSAMIGELPVLLFVLPYPDELTPMSIWMSPSAARFAWGKINCQLLLNCGYWLFAKLEIWMLSASHKPAINEISARVFVIVVVPK